MSVKTLLDKNLKDNKDIDQKRTNNDEDELTAEETETERDDSENSRIFAVIQEAKNTMEEKKEIPDKNLKERDDNKRTKSRKKINSDEKNKEKTPKKGNNTKEEGMKSANKERKNEADNKNCKKEQEEQTEKKDRKEKQADEGKDKKKGRATTVEKKNTNDKSGDKENNDEGKEKKDKRSREEKESRDKKKDKKTDKRPERTSGAGKSLKEDDQILDKESKREIKSKSKPKTKVQKVEDVGASNALNKKEKEVKISPRRRKKLNERLARERRQSSRSLCSLPVSGDESVSGSNSISCASSISASKSFSGPLHCDREKEEVLVSPRRRKHPRNRLSRFQQGKSLTCPIPVLGDDNDGCSTTLRRSSSTNSGCRSPLNRRNKKEEELISPLRRKRMSARLRHGGTKEDHELQRTELQRAASCPHHIVDDDRNGGVDDERANSGSTSGTAKTSNRCRNSLNPAFLSLELEKSDKDRLRLLRQKRRFKEGSGEVIRSSSMKSIYESDKNNTEEMMVSPRRRTNIDDLVSRCARSYSSGLQYTGSDDDDDVDDDHRSIANSATTTETFSVVSPESLRKERDTKEHGENEKDDVLSKYTSKDLSHPFPPKEKSAPIPVAVVDDASENGNGDDNVSCNQRPSPKESWLEPIATGIEKYLSKRGPMQKAKSDRSVQSEQLYHKSASDETTQEQGDGSSKAHEEKDAFMSDISYSWHGERKSPWLMEPAADEDSPLLNQAEESRIRGITKNNKSVKLNNRKKRKQKGFGSSASVVGEDASDSTNYESEDDVNYVFDGLPSSGESWMDPILKGSFPMLKEVLQRTTQATRIKGNNNDELKQKKQNGSSAGVMVEDASEIAHCHEEDGLNYVDDPLKLWMEPIVEGGLPPKVPPKTENTMVLDHSESNRNNSKKEKRQRLDCSSPGSDVVNENNCPTAVVEDVSMSDIDLTLHDSLLSQESLTETRTEEDSCRLSSRDAVRNGVETKATGNSSKSAKSESKRRKQGRKSAPVVVEDASMSELSFSWNDEAPTPEESWMEPVTEEESWATGILQNTEDKRVKGADTNSDKSNKRKNSKQKRRSDAAVVVEDASMTDINFQWQGETPSPGESWMEPIAEGSRRKGINRSSKNNIKSSKITTDKTKRKQKRSSCPAVIAEDASESAHCENEDDMEYIWRDRQQSPGDSLMEPIEEENGLSSKIAPKTEDAREKKVVSSKKKKIVKKKKQN